MARLPESLPADIPTLLDAFGAGARAALGPRLVALYLFGSALSDDFAPATSDLDFLGVLTEPPTPGEVAALSDLHRRLAAEWYWGARLEGGYAARGALRPWGIEGRITAFAAEEGFQPDVPSDYSADNVAALRASSVSLVGPPAAEVVPEVDRATLEAGLREYLAELLARPEATGTSEDLASWTLNVARCLYGVEAGRPSSKREAAKWLAGRSPGTRPALEAALAVRAGQATPADLSALRAGHAYLKGEAAGWSARL